MDRGGGEWLVGCSREPSLVREQRVLVTSKRVAVCEDLGPKGPRVGDCFLLLKKVYQPLNWLDREVNAHFQARLWQAGRQAFLETRMGFGSLVPGPPSHRPGPFPEPQ